MKTFLIALSFFVSTLAFSLTSLTDVNVKQKITETTSGIIVFHADWCPACKQFMPIVKKIEGDYPTLKFMTVDVEVERELAKAAPSIPTTYFIFRGKVVNRIIGSGPESEIKKALDDFLKFIEKQQ